MGEGNWKHVVHTAGNSNARIRVILTQFRIQLHCKCCTLQPCSLQPGADQYFNPFNNPVKSYQHYEFKSLCHDLLDIQLSIFSLFLLL